MVKERVSRKGSSETPRVDGRLLTLRIIACVAFLGLFAQVWRLQIIEGQRYTEWADRIRFRQISLPAPRGVIYTRGGEILVRNIPSFTVSIVPADLPEDRERERQVISRLVSLLELTDETWLVTPFSTYGAQYPFPEYEEAQAMAASLRNRERMRDPVDVIEAQIDEVRDTAPYRPLLIKTNVERERAFILEEELSNLPGVHLDVEPLRLYTTGELTAHLLGYVGQIPGEQLESYVAAGYELNDTVGLTGLELVYEETLRGKKGLKNVEVDVAGREVRIIGDVTPPTPGNNLILTLDLKLQEITTEALRRGLEDYHADSGVAIVMNPNNGEILAMVSIPGYDNNLFTGGISWQDYERLSNDPRRPLVNHAISGQYPPGSTFKIVPAAAGLQEGVIGPKTSLQCEGIMLLPNKYFPDDPEKAQKFYCWIHQYGMGHGRLNVVEALAQSCDIFFYQVGGGFRDFAGLGLDRLAQYGLEFGFGERTGIDLPGESTGLIPSARWKRLNYAESWVTGDTYNMSIGQGFVLATPLQLLNATAAIANGGTLYRPHLVKEITDPDGKLIQTIGPTVLRQLPLSEQTISIVQNGLVAAVERGTARTAGLVGVRVAGKTGTAEFPGPRDKEGNLPTHAWFVAYAPFEQPEIAVVVFVYGGGEGSKVAAPIAAKILSAYFGVPPVSVEAPHDG